MNSEILNRTYRILEKRGPSTCSEIGWALWGSAWTTYKTLSKDVHNMNKFCRPAGKVLKTLEKKGMVSRFDNGDKVIWKAVPSGELYGRDFISDNFMH